MTYPTNIFSPRTKEDKPGTVYDANKKTISYAKDLTDLDAEVVGIETELGTDPKGDFGSVKERLENNDLLNPDKTKYNVLMIPEIIKDQDGSGINITTNSGTINFYTSASGANWGIFNALPYALNYSKETTFDLEVERIQVSSNGKIRIICDLYEGTDTVQHIGFKFDGSTVYATSVDSGGTEENTDITSQVSIGTGRHRWKWVLDPGVSIKFYFDGVLVATHTTRIPSGTPDDTALLVVYIDNNGDASINRIEMTHLVAEIES